MDLYEKTIKFITENKANSYFTGGIGEEEIINIEKELQLQLPDSYKWFLKNFGSGGLYGIDTLGYDYGGASVVETTEEYCNHFNLSEGLVVIEDIDFFAYALDTNKMNSNNECPVLIWDRVLGYQDKLADSFIEFFYKRLLEKKENWEEDEDWDD
ncbi:SMI1/KNR4 family protein [Bacillus subtilis]|nr:SMI1/KNR4 family protein [Bacillus subtilis]